MTPHETILEEVCSEIGTTIVIDHETPLWKVITLEAMRRLEQQLTQQQEFNKVIDGMPKYAPEEEYVVKCYDCHTSLTIVRPGKYQCDNPNCKTNNKNYFKHFC